MNFSKALSFGLRHKKKSEYASDKTNGSIQPEGDVDAEAGDHVAEGTGCDPAKQKPDS